MTLYAATIFLSAFLLFQSQPLIAKIILPWFGGSAAVWSAALLFFQLMLLAGYAYAHFLIRFLKARAQMAVHGTLLAASCALLPILPSPLWKPVGAGDPTLRILAVLLTTLGMPYFLLSATSPLLQAWYVRRSGSVSFRQLAHSRQYIIDEPLLPLGERIRRVAIRAAQVARRQPHEDARQPGKGALPLQTQIDFIDDQCVGHDART